MPRVKIQRLDVQINLETLNKLTSAKRLFLLWKLELENIEPGVMFHLELFQRLLKRGENEAGEPFSAKMKWWDKSEGPMPQTIMKHRSSHLLKSCHFLHTKMFGIYTVPFMSGTPSLTMYDLRKPLLIFPPFNLCPQINCKKTKSNGLDVYIF